MDQPAVSHNMRSWLLLSLLAIARLATIAGAADNATLYAVKLDGADEAAFELLRVRLNDAFRAERNLHLPKWELTLDSKDYEDVIRALLTRQGPYIAHMTPYVYVVAEMLGVEMHILATYESKSTGGEKTYRSYFVVNKERFDEIVEWDGMKPDHQDLLTYLREIGKERSAKFIYHNRYSTSSYFQPAVYFREHRIITRPAGSSDNPSLASDVIWIESDEIESDSSSALVRGVLANEGDGPDFAAVWDGTKAKFPEEGVYFIDYSYELPNDLLVCPSNLSDKTKTALKELITFDVNPINTGDFNKFVEVDRTARQALTRLRLEATQLLSTVVIEIDWGGGITDENQHKWIAAARTALRIAGPEFVERDEDFHIESDVLWTLRPLHDEAVELISTVQFVIDRDYLEQKAVLSFTGEDELEQLILDFMHERMHRIRYIWPYRGEPTVFRNFDVEAPKGSKHTVVPMEWSDRLQNDYDTSGEFEAEVITSDDYKIVFDDGPFREHAVGELQFDPMSQTAFRVVLVRPIPSNTLFRVLTVVFLVVLVLAAIFAVADLRRRQVRERPRPTLSFQARCDEAARAYHQPWADKDIIEADVRWCDRQRLEKLVADLQQESPSTQLGVKVRERSRKLVLGIKIPKLLCGGGEIAARQMSIATADPTKITDASRAQQVVNYMVRTERLSSLVGRPIGWSVGEDAVRDALGIADDRVNIDSDQIAQMVADQFSRTLKDALRRPSWFCADWAVQSSTKKQIVIEHRLESRQPLSIEEVPEPVQSIVLRGEIARTDSCRFEPDQKTLRAWALVTLADRPDEADHEEGALELNVQLILLVAEAHVAK